MTRAYPLPPDVAAGRNPTALIDQTAQVFVELGYAEMSTGDLTDWAAMVRRFINGEERLHKMPDPGQCPRCFARCGDPHSPVVEVPGEERPVFECRRCDRRFGARVPDPTVVGGAS